MTTNRSQIGARPRAGWGGFDLVQTPGSRHSLSKFAVVIESLDQTLMLAPHLLGRDALQRELSYDEFKRALRQYDHMGHGFIDIARWDLFGKRVGLPISALLGGRRRRLPASASTTHGDRNGVLSRPAALGVRPHSL
jgi:L-alanine-DL-glutamate epimerase-like enolase superfamily enzyme